MTSSSDITRRKAFRTRYDEARKEINQWVAEQTNQRIVDLIGPGLVNSLTRLVLVNAIYFKGEWREPFLESQTRRAPFQLSEGGTVETELMIARGIESARYAAFDTGGSFFDTPHEIPLLQPDDEIPAKYPDERGFALLELPYKGDRLSMVFLAPNRTDRLPEIEHDLTLERLEHWIEQLVPRAVHVELPRFKLETDYRLVETLRSMGMIRAFRDPTGPGGAQFGGMTTSSDPLEQPYISKVIHKAFLEVNEKGTEAAATAIMVQESACSPQTRVFVPTFRADRPFLFLIRDRVNGCILFAGRLTRPPTV